MKEKETCPFCGKETERTVRTKGAIVIYECAECKQITVAYSKEMHDRLRDFGNWYEIDTFKPKPPEWVRRKVN